MSAKYLYTQIIRGNLIFEEVFALNTWKKYQADVEKMLKDNGYEHLIKPIVK